MCRDNVSMATQHKFYEIRQELYLFIRDNYYDIEAQEWQSTVTS